MPIAPSMSSVFLRRFQSTVVAVGAVLRLGELIYSYRSGRLDIFEWLMIILFGLPPYVALAIMAGRIAHKVILIVAAIFIVAGELATFWGVIHSRSSTGAVALFFEPFLAAIIVVPLAWYIAYVLRH